MRVNELSKELGKTNKEVLEILKKNNYDVKSHASNITEEQVAVVKRAFGAGKPAPAEKPAPPPSARNGTGKQTQVWTMEANFRENQKKPIFKKESRLIPYFDIPFQHASEPILKAMGRKGNKDKYLKLVSSVREALPDSVIRSTMMLGFPGEKDEDFKCLMEFLKEAELDWCGFFTYSREEGTKAFSLKGKVPIAEAGLRKEQAQELQNRITEKRLESYVGKEIEVLVEEIIAEEEIALGRGYMNAPEVDGAVILHSGLAADGGVRPGDVVRAKVIKRNNIDLEAVDVRLS